LDHPRARALYLVPLETHLRAVYGEFDNRIPILSSIKRIVSRRKAACPQ
jgi:hypothetical protein